MTRGMLNRPPESRRALPGWRCCVLIAALTSAGAIGTAGADVNPIVVPTMARLKAVNVAGIAKHTVAIVIDYYETTETAFQPYQYPTYGRGGGMFRWRSGATNADDGGRFIMPNSNTNAGRWERMLNGNTANVKMWGAKGDNSTDDTRALRNAAKACIFPWASELLIPAGSYVIKDTIVIFPTTHVRGESPWFTGTQIRVPAEVRNKDVFRTSNAEAALKGGLHQVNGLVRNQFGELVDWDHGLVFENLTIQIEDTSPTSTAAALVLCPGEASTIRNIGTLRGGYGIRSLGVGAPGLRIQNVTLGYAAVAGVSIEALELTDGSITSIMGPVTLMGVGGDCFDAAKAPTASLIRIYRCVPTVSVYDLKAEGVFGGGVILYHEPSSGIGSGAGSGSICVHGGTYNATWSKAPAPADVVVLKSDRQHSATVLLEPMNLFGVRYLIRDEVAGRNVDADVCTFTGNSQTALRIPISYESMVTAAAGAKSRLVVGQTAIYSFIPTKIGWYRIMAPISGPAPHLMGAKLVISSIRESTELQVSALPYGTDGTQITVARATKYNPSLPPVVTKARAATYRDPRHNASMSIVDVYVENPIQDAGPAKLKRVTFAMDINGYELLDSAEIYLASPTKPVTTLLPHPGCVLVNSSGEIPIVRR